MLKAIRGPPGLRPVIYEVQIRLPEARHERLQTLCDRQDEQGRLSSQERREAKGLVPFVDMLALLRLRADRGQKRSA